MKWLPICRKSVNVKTFFIGKMSGDKIVGTSVDEAGIRGEWTAVRITAD
jgi:hypothetical protein